MKRVLILICLLFCAVSAQAVNQVTATVTITGATADGNTITVNGDVRTWKNTVTVSATQIQDDGSANNSKTNMYKHFGLSPLSQVKEVDNGAASILLVGNAGVVMTVTLVGGYGTVTYSTQAVSTAVAVRLTTSIEAAAQQTNINSGLLAALRATSNTNQFLETDYAVSNLVGAGNSQVVYGAKLMTNIGNVFAGTITNGLNVGTAFSSPGAGSGSEQFGSGALSAGQSSVSVGGGSRASSTAATALGNTAIAFGGASTAVGTGSGGLNTNDSAFGAVALARGTNSTALGAFTTVSATHTNTTVIGYGASSTAANQILLGGSGINAVVQNALSVGAGGNFVNGITNLWLTGTNTIPAGADIAFGRFAITTLVNAPSANSDLVVGTNVFVEVSGPSAAFSINGIAGGRNGKLVIIINRTGFGMTFANESGSESTAANRIVTMTGADRTTTGNGAAFLLYNANSSRWMLITLEPIVSAGVDSGAWHVGGDGLSGSPNKIGPISAADYTTVMQENGGPGATVAQFATYVNNESVNIKMGGSNTFGSPNFGAIILGMHNSTGNGPTWPTILGGGFNSVGPNGNQATVVGGATNSANGAFSLACGQGATAANDNSFVWSGIGNYNVTTSGSGGDNGTVLFATANGFVITNSTFGRLQMAGTAINVETNLASAAIDLRLGYSILPVAVNTTLTLANPDSTGKFVQHTYTLVTNSAAGTIVLTMPPNTVVVGSTTVTRRSRIEWEQYARIQTNAYITPIN